MLNWLKKLMPDEYIASVFDLDLGKLKGLGIEALLIDLDNTLLPRNSLEIPPLLFKWLEQVEDMGFKVCLISNNWPKRVRQVAERLQVPLVARAGKPMKKAFEKGLRKLETPPQKTAIIGDQLFTDILGGRRLSLRTILVKPVSENDLPHTKILRWLERLVLKSRES